MEQPLNRIKRLSLKLPKGDIKYAEKYIKSREFDKLLEIVDSDIYLVHQNEQLEVPKEKYANIVLEDLIELKAAIEEYMSFFEITNNSENDIEWYE